MSEEIKVAPPEWMHVDRQRGTWGMALFIGTEAALFVMFFFSYYFLAAQNPEWPIGEAPKLMLALIMTVVLVSSSFVLHWGEKAEQRRHFGKARLAVGLTILLGVIFLVIQVFEYRDHLRTLTPHSDAYGSIFYTITSFHAAHVATGLLFLLFVLLLPRLKSSERPPHRSLHNASMYWHFVDVVWLTIITLLYIVPNLRL